MKRNWDIGKAVLLILQSKVQECSYIAQVFLTEERFLVCCKISTIPSRMSVISNINRGDVTKASIERILYTRAYLLDRNQLRLKKGFNQWNHTGLNIQPSIIKPRRPHFKNAPGH